MDHLDLLQPARPPWSQDTDSTNLFDEWRCCRDATGHRNCYETSGSVVLCEAIQLTTRTTWGWEGQYEVCSVSCGSRDGGRARPQCDGRGFWGPWPRLSNTSVRRSNLDWRLYWREWRLGLDYK